MAVTEKRVVEAIKKRLEQKPKAFVFKSHGGPMQTRGLPDIMGCYDGFFFGIEAKAPGKEKNVTDLQAKKLRDIRKAGGIAFVSSNPRHAMLQLLKEVKKKRGNSK